jgi:hypothetical protein
MAKNDRFFMTKQSYYHSWFYDNVEELSWGKSWNGKSPFSLEKYKSTRPKRRLWKKAM